MPLNLTTHGQTVGSTLLGSCRMTSRDSREREVFAPGIASWLSRYVAGLDRCTRYVVGQSHIIETFYVGAVGHQMADVVNKAIRIKGSDKHGLGLGGRQLREQLYRFGIDIFQG